MNDTAINATASAFGALVRFSPGAVELSTVDGETRCVSAILNTEDVGLDNHVIRTAGLDTESYMVGGGLVPFCHKTDEPPVARMLELSKRVNRAHRPHAICRRRDLSFRRHRLPPSARQVPQRHLHFVAACRVGTHG